MQPVLNCTRILVTCLLIALYMALVCLLGSAVTSSRIDLPIPSSSAVLQANCVDVRVTVDATESYDIDAQVLPSLKTL